MLLLKDLPTQLAFSVSENPGVFALLLGSGLSRSASIPTGWEITLDLVRRLGALHGAENVSDWAAWYREVTGKEPNYSEILEEIATTPDERRAILHRYIEPDEDDRQDGRKVPTPAHHAIAALVASGHIRLIVTTNFDRLMENALRERGIEPTVVSSADALVGAEPLVHSKCFLLKLHGDYKDARILNTDAELSAYPEPYGELLDRVLDEHGMIVCGWSGEWDHALRKALLRARNRRYPTYWATFGESGAGALELIQQRRAHVVEIQGADPFFTSLQGKIETLEGARRANPISTELLISTAKRLLPRPESRIQLGELVYEEADRLMASLDSTEFDMSVQPTDESLKARVSALEARTEVVAKLLGVLGRWGDGQSFDLALDTVKSLIASSTRNRSGHTLWISVAGYPAAISFACFGIGLARAKRWSELHQALTAVMAVEDREPRSASESVFHGSWALSVHDAWKRLPTLEARKTPVSDRLFELLGSWAKSFLGTEADFEGSFEMFEFLGALTCFAKHGKPYLEERLAECANNGDILAWMPAGRVAWRRAGLQMLRHRVVLGGEGTSLLASGFADGDPRVLELCLDNFDRYARRVFWG
jgi:hypothetical protein